jgi:tRNA-Thr(GGU) m(6)t(6)A37 methyltransferase TsaA
MAEIKFKPIGKIHTPFTTLDGMPVQPAGAEGVTGQVHLDPKYADGLQDLDGFSHIYLIYHLHKVTRQALRVKPFLDDVLRGVFATRAPVRPNPIGLSVVELVRVEGTVLHIKNVDILDGTPLLDLKPFIPEFTNTKSVRIGWLESKRGQVQQKKADRRFV